MKNQPLIQEVISQISQRFAPKIPDIKKVGVVNLLVDFVLILRFLFLGNRHVTRERVH